MPGSKKIGRYTLYDEIASGGMATVHLGRAEGDDTIVAIKRLRRELAAPDVVDMFLDEARLAGRLRHPNVVPVIDVVSEAHELLLVMEYVLGEPLNWILRELRERGERVPPPILSAIARDALLGVQAAHELEDQHGQSLGLVHRDVSPPNIMVGMDGISRVLDFGIAKARGRVQVTREGEVKGKIAYLAPEQLHGEVSPATDIHAMGIVLWEALVSQRLFLASNEAATITRIATLKPKPPSEAGARTDALDAIVLKALEKEPDARFSSAREMADALVRAIPPAETTEVALWLRRLAQKDLAHRQSQLARIGMEPSGVTEVHEPDRSPLVIGLAIFASLAVAGGIAWLLMRR